MLLKYYDTVFKRYRLTKAKGLYICGPTLYDDLHIGNMRPIIFGDYIKRNLDIKYVTNITDIDDKIFEKTDIKNYIFYIKKQYLKYRKILIKLEIRSPDIEMSVYRNIKNLIKYIEKLPFYKDKNEFRFKSYKPSYISNSKEKAEFSVWKFRENGFNSSMGKGIPGWHCECSYFIESNFQQLCLHGGGKDLKDIHHQNECHMLKNSPIGWIHTGLLLVNGEKMSKSKGDKILASEWLKKHGFVRLKLVFMNTIYHRDIDLNRSFLKEIENLRNYFYWSLYNNRNRKSNVLKVYMLKNIFQYSKMVYLIKKYKFKNSDLTFQIFNFLGIEDKKLCLKDIFSFISKIYLKYLEFKKLQKWEVSDFYRKIYMLFINKNRYNWSYINDIKLNKKPFKL